MFFAPTLLALTRHKHETEPGANHKSGLITNSKLNSGLQTQLESDGVAATPEEVNKGDMDSDKVYSLCLSTGDADGLDRKSTRLNSSHSGESRMPSSA